MNVFEWKKLSVLLFVGCIQFLTTLGSAQETNVLLTAPIWTNAQLQFTLTGEANVFYVIEKSQDLQNWNPVVTNGAFGSTRLIALASSDDQSFFRVSKKFLPLSSFAILAKETIGFGGNKVTIDSFDSANPSYSTGGKYDPLKAKDRGNVASGSSLVGAINLGNSTIKGAIKMAAGGLPIIGPNGVVGSAAWFASGNKGIQPGYFSDDLIVFFPEVSVSSVIGLPPPSGVFGGTNYSYILTSGNYWVSNLSGKLCVASGNAVLYVSDSLQLGGNASIYLAAGASLRLFAGAPSSSLQQIYNTGCATNFQYYGFSNNTNITITEGFTGTIYAPSAGVKFSGNGGVIGFQGSCICKTFSVIGGSTAIHFDERSLNQ